MRSLAHIITFYECEIKYCPKGECKGTYKVIKQSKMFPKLRIFTIL